MSKLNFTLVGLSLFLSVAAQAQQRSINMALAITSPPTEDTIAVGAPVPFTLVLENQGPDALVAGDSLFVQLPDNSVQLFQLQEGLALGQSTTLLNANITVPVDITTTFELCATLSDDPSTQVQIEGNAISVSYIDPDASNNTTCNTLTILVDDPSGIKETADATAALLLYPNPANNKVTLSYTDGGRILSARIFNVLGAEVYHAKGSGTSEQTIDVQQLANGTYLLHIDTDKGVAVRKLNIIR